MAAPLVIAKNKDTEIALLPALANRHGLIAGATGTGKTVTLQALAQQFSNIGVPVLLADVKGDLSGIGAAGEMRPKLKERLDLLRIADFTFEACPVVFWDVFGESGHPARTTVSDLGPLLLGRLLNLNDVQEGVLQLVFKIADERGLLLLDLKDLRAMLQYAGDNAGALTTEYGRISAASIGAIQRGLVALEGQGGEQLFGEPMLDINDLMQTDGQGRGVVNILSSEKLLNAPAVYSTFLLWLLAELFENLPEVGDAEKPRLVFFFDEAHLLFEDAPKPLLDKIEQVVRLIRSKGIGVYFVTQNPSDIPDSILGQLGNRVQHALRAFTPRDQKAVKVAAETMRRNPRLDVERVISELAVGEALVSLLDEKGAPGIVERAYILPPASRIGPMTGQERATAIRNSVLSGHYEKKIDRESAYEKLKERAEGGRSETSGASAGEASAGADWTDRWMGRLGTVLGGGSGRKDNVVEAMAKSAARTIGSQVGREIVRGVLGSLLGGTATRRRR
jgi:DNA helicase HerA-like ATPase